MTAQDFNRAAGIQKPNRPLLVAGGRTLSYGEQWNRIRALRAWCEAQGLGVGSPVIVAVTDELEQASLLLALICCGRPPLILDPHGTPDEAAAILGDSDFSALIAEAPIHRGWGLSRYERPWLQVRTPRAAAGVFGRLLGKRNGGDPEPGWPGLADQPSASELEQVPGDALAYVVFTSGTTSRPKGVEIAHRALLSQMAVLRSQYRLDDSCRLLNTLPLHHVDGLLQGPLLAWFCGITVYRPMAFSVQTLQGYLDSIYRDRISHLIAVPTMLSLIARLGHEWREVFASPDFRCIVSCAGHLEQALWADLEAGLGVPVVNMYGLTETGTSALFSGPDEESRRVGSLGKPVNCTLRIVDENGAEANPGEIGELLISGDQLMRGYHRDREGTDEVLRGGWLFTGDLVREVDTGHLALVGRKKNQIISGGRNISPEEIAAVLNLHPQVIESVVLGEPDPEWGERVTALAVVEGKGPDEADLADWCRTRLSEYKVPKQILHVERLPRGPSGKVRIDAARQLLDERRASAGMADAGNALGDRLRTIAAQTFRIHVSEIPAHPTPENTPGWDSLAHMELVVALERAFGIRLSAREIMQMDSLDKAQALCREKAGG